MKRIYIKPKMRVIDDEMFDLCDSGPALTSKHTQITDNPLDPGGGDIVVEDGDADAKGTQLWEDLSGW